MKYLLVYCLLLPGCQPASEPALSSPLPPNYKPDPATLFDAHSKISDAGPIGGMAYMNELMQGGNCDVLIGFGSHATGIPIHHAVLAKDWLIKSPDVDKIHRISWGKEGEVSFCATIADATKHQTIAQDLNQAVNQLGRAENGYVTPATAEKTKK